MLKCVIKLNRFNNWNQCVFIFIWRERHHQQNCKNQSTCDLNMKFMTSEYFVSKRMLCVELNVLIFRFTILNHILK